MIRFLDTNAVLNTDLNKEENLVISSITLEELEKIKTNRNKTEEVKYKARKAIHWLDENQDKYNVIIFNQDIYEELNNSSGLAEYNADTYIMACCAYTKFNNEVVFVTDDICCKVLAKNVFGLKVEGLKNKKENIYKGYKFIKGNTATINQVLSDTSEWLINEYAIIKNTDDGSGSEMRFDGEKFVALKLPPSKYIKGKNALQRCALDILNNQDITIAAILGGYGSGKTFLCMQMGLYSVREKGWQSKILGVREPQGEGKEVGYLPGELNSKTELFFAPLMQQLDGGEFELERLMQQGMLESNIPYYLKGTTYNDTVILVDEAEDLSDKQIRLIGTRLGEGSKIYLAGDYKQAVYNATETNALIRMCNAFKGDPKFACIYLGEDVRSTTSRMFADLFND